MARPKDHLISLLNIFSSGALLGIIFLKSEVASWQRIHDMFLFREPRMFLIIGTAIVVAMVTIRLAQRWDLRNLEGQRVEYEPKPFQLGVVFGGLLFGAGWALTGACPGPIYAQIGSGEPMALMTFAGAMLGVYAYAWLKPKLPH